MYLLAVLDIDLCEKARAGDSDAELRMIERYRPLIERAANNAAISGIPREDLAAEATIAVIKAVRAFQPKHVSFASFSKRCVHNRFASLARFSGRRIRLHSHALIDADHLNGGHEENIEDGSARITLDGVYTEDLVARLAAVLNEKEKFVLTNLLARGGLNGADEGMSANQIAETMGCSRASVWRVIEEIRRKATEVFA